MNLINEFCLNNAPTYTQRIEMIGIKRETENKSLKLLLKRRRELIIDLNMKTC